MSAYIKSTKAPSLQFVNNKRQNKKIELPALAVKLLMDILGQIGQGNAVSIIPVHAELTTQQAADFLNVSRPYLIDLLSKGDIPFRKVGTKRRVLAKDVIRYKTTIDKKRDKALAELTKQAQLLKMGYERVSLL